jgi:hypothetical protein
MLYRGTCFIYLCYALACVLLCLACVALQHLGKLHLLCLLAAAYNELTSRIWRSASIFSLCTRRLTERKAVEYLKKRDQSEIEQVFVKLEFFFSGSQNRNFVKLYSVSDRYAWLLREWLHWKFCLSVTLREQNVLPVVKNASEFKKGKLNVQLRIFLTCVEAGQDFTSETLEKTANWLRIYNNWDTRCSYCTWRQKKRSWKRIWGGGRVTILWVCHMTDLDMPNCTVSRCVRYGSLTQI